jgi:FAD/FMN-containing dehydrogenase
MRSALARFEDIRPAAHFTCGSPEHVVLALDHARSAGLPVAVRSGGHCFAGRSSTDGVLIDLWPMQGLTLEDGRATIGAGGRLGMIYDRLSEHGVTIAAGCGPTVGISGLVLGGGLGILGRKHGLTSDSLVGAELVLADGSLVRADDDLLWGLRGAGGARFGVVTSLELATVPAPAMTAFETYWDDPGAMIAAWQEWAPDAPDGLAASLLITTPPLQVKVFGAFAGAKAEARDLLRELGRPARAQFWEGGARGVKTFLAGAGGEDDGHAYLRSEYFARSLSGEAIDALVAHLGAGDGFHRELDFSPWAGAYNRTPVEASAFAHRDARFLLKHAAVVEPGGPVAEAREWLDHADAITHPYGTGGKYPNFPEDGLDPWAVEYLGANRDRLLGLKRRYDPEGVFM